MTFGQLALKAVSACAFLAAIPAFCQCIPSDERTRWGGNEQVVIDESKPLKTIRGKVVQDLESLTPWKDVLVEIYDHPEVHLQDFNSRKVTQRRIVGCRTNDTGIFSFHLPRGRYEVRISCCSGVNVTSVLVRLGGSPFVSRRSLVVKPVLGT